MAMDGQVVAALNRQVVIELDTSYLYLQMATWFEGRKLAGLCGWMRRQANAEVAHAQILFKYLVEREAEATFAKVDAPKRSFRSGREILTRALAQARLVEGCIGRALDTAARSGDRATSSLLDWFAYEQSETEERFSRMHERARHWGDAESLRALDAELAAGEQRIPESLHARPFCRLLFVDAS